MFTPPAITQVKMAASEFLIGADPLEREGIWQRLWKSFRHTDHLGLGPIDVALWDLAGKHYGASVAELLGGYRERVPAYASTFTADVSGGLETPENFAAFARQCADEGYPAFKIHPAGEPDRDIEVCRAVAEEVGDEMDLMLDPASEYNTYAQTLKVGRELDELGYFWYEDPLAETGESEHAMGKLVRELEHSRTGPFGRVNHMKSDALDFVRGDAHLDGGITGVMKVAHATEGFGLDVELHVGGPAHLHCMSAIRNTNYFEDGLLHPEVEWMSDQGFTEPVEEIDDDGTVAVPDGVGLGVDIDWDFVKDRQTDHTHIDTTGASGLS
jgi:L-alanine-DL-glutamate epimerase-like enolase superfamily enzyme